MRLFILVSVLGAAFAAPNAASKFGGNRIVGGSDADIASYPYMSNMQYQSSGIYWSQGCGGSLMTPTTVLSAAHCFTGLGPHQWRVRLGTRFASSGGTVHLVTHLILHEKFDEETMEADIAIVRLATAAVISNTVALVRLAGHNYHLPDGTDLTALGWGRLHSDGSGSENLKYVVINQINQELCAERYAYLKTTDPYWEHWPDITADMLCAGILDVGGKDTCTGDSGGPLAHNGDVLVGVTSWNFDCGDPFYPSVFVRVSYFVDWIVQNGSG